MTSSYIKKTLSIYLLIVIWILPITGQSGSTRENILKLLTETSGGSVHQEKSLSRLFEVGDEGIGFLVEALDHPDPLVSLRSQAVIRYLGNAAGVEGLLRWYDNQETFPVAGPVPLPLMDRDYKVIQTNFIDRPTAPWTRAEPYIYALALSRSSRAKETLETLLEVAMAHNDESIEHRTAVLIKSSEPAKVLKGKKRLEELVLEEAFFISPADRKYTSARLLAMNGAKNKALIKVSIDRGVLSEETYHVVIQKCENGWQFFTVTPVAVS